MQEGKEVAILRFLGLAMRAGKVVSGFDQVGGALAKGKVKLLIISEDISKRTLDDLLNEVLRTDSLYKEPLTCYRVASSEQIGDALGKKPRAVVAVLDEGFASKLAMMIDDLDQEEDK